LLKKLPYNDRLSTVIPPRSNTTSRNELDERRPMANVSNVYSLAQEKMIASVRRPENGKYEAPSEYGPYHAQYWSIVENSLDDDIPLAANGSYQSPYGSLTPEIYFPGVADHTSDSYSMNQQQNGYDHPDGSAYTLGRNTPYTLPPEAANVYPSPVDNFNWNYFPSSMDTTQQNQSTLDNLASQILNMLLSSSVEGFVASLSNPDSMPNSQAFANLESMFERITRQFPHDGSSQFIDISQMQLTSTASLSTIRKANLAIFALNVFRSRDVPFMDLNNAFLDIFMPAGTCLLKNETSLFLELKTQAFMAIVMSHNYPRALLDQLFPRDLQLTILRRRPEPPYPAPSEQDFISRLNERRQYLLACSDDAEALSELPQKYPWNDFLSELRTCIRRNLEYLDRAKVSYSAFTTNG
jgi:hypothetical protein